MAYAREDLIKTKRVKPHASHAPRASMVKIAVSCILLKQTAVPTVPLANIVKLKAFHRRAGATLALREHRVKHQAWIQEINVRPQPKANITTGKNVRRVHTKMRRARHLVSHALLENTEKIAPSSILLKQTAASTALRVNTAVQRASRRTADVTLALLEELVQPQAWTRARNARRRQQANTITEKLVCRAPSKIKLGRRLASLAQLENTEKIATRCTLPKRTAVTTACWVSTAVQKASPHKAAVMTVQRAV